MSTIDDARIEHLPWNAPLSAYEAQAATLHAAYLGGSPAAIALVHRSLPRFLDPVITWLPRDVTSDEIQRASLTLDDVRLAIARLYSFRDWAALCELVANVADAASPVHRFECAVDAVITGDASTLAALLRDDPALVTARSSRITSHDPAQHRATLLHYCAANGVEGYRQRVPQNAVAIATMLLHAGAAPDALAGMYGAECTTLSMLVSSTPPHAAGVQVPLLHALLDAGANPDGAGVGAWNSPLITALVFGFADAAHALEQRDARVDDLVKAAGLGRAALCAELLPGATSEARHRALALAAMTGHHDVVALLLDAGEDPNALNPAGFHAHSAPLHQAVCHGHLAVVELLVTRGADVHREDSIWHGDAMGWALHCEQPHVASYLRELVPEWASR